MLYRLDFHSGHSVRPVKVYGRDYLATRLTTARADAKRFAHTFGEDVVITRISSSGRLRPMWRVSPDCQVRRIP
jgi:hypothetical protein